MLLPTVQSAVEVVEIRIVDFKTKLPPCRLITATSLPFTVSTTIAAIVMSYMDPRLNHVVRNAALGTVLERLYPCDLC